jgi:hypothetical protein
MLLKAFAKRLRRRVPLVAIMLAASCLLTAIPKFFAGESYSSFVGATLRAGAWWCWTLP